MKGTNILSKVLKINLVYMLLLPVELQAGNNQPVTERHHCRSARQQNPKCKMTAKRLFLCPPHKCTAVHAVSRVVSMLPSRQAATGSYRLRSHFMSIFSGFFINMCSTAKL